MWKICSSHDLSRSFRRSRGVTSSLSAAPLFPLAGADADAGVASASTSPFLFIGAAQEKNNNSNDGTVSRPFLFSFLVSSLKKK